MAKARTIITIALLAIPIIFSLFGLSLSSASSQSLSSHVSPAPVAPRIRAGFGTSLNWAGYAVTGSSGSVSDVKGSWVVPAIVGSCPSSNQYSSFWVGIDGYSSSTVEQTGTDSDCQNGAPTYYAWYEFYPRPSFIISSLTVSPGDKISAEVSYGSGSFTVSITDVSTSQSFSTSARVNSAQRSSAEWIAEAPSSGGSIMTLANFGIANYGYDNTGVTQTNYATLGGITGAMNSFGSSVQEITMVTSSGSVLAQPSSPSSDGTSFSVTYGGSSTSTTTSTTTTSSTSTSTSTLTALSVSVSTDKSSYTQDSWAYITVTVTSSGTPVAGASVTVTVTNPNGGVAQGSGTTNSNGVVTFKYRIGPNAPLGTYTVDASASASGYNPGSGSTTFTVT